MYTQDVCHKMNNILVLEAVSPVAIDSTHCTGQPNEAKRQKVEKHVNIKPDFVTPSEHYLGKLPQKSNECGFMY